MSFWDEVDRLTKKSEAEYLGTQAELKAIGFVHMSVSDYGAWRATHKYIGWITARNGGELLEAARRALQAFERQRENLKRT